MELDEFEVGDVGAGAQGQRDAIGGGPGRVGRGRVEMSGAAGGEQDRRRVHGVLDAAA